MFSVYGNTVYGKLTPDWWVHMDQEDSEWPSEAYEKTQTLASWCIMYDSFKLARTHLLRGLGTYTS